MSALRPEVLRQKNCQCSTESYCGDGSDHFLQNGEPARCKNLGHMGKRMKKKTPGPKWPRTAAAWKNGQKMAKVSFWPSFFFHFGNHFSAISGLGPFSTFFPIFSRFLCRAGFPFCRSPLPSQSQGLQLILCQDWQKTLQSQSPSRTADLSQCFRAEICHKLSEHNDSEGC